MSAKVKADKELRFAQGLIIPVLEAINEAGVTSAFHICRGNYTRDENALLVGAYDKLVRTLEKLPVDVYMLEFSTPRAGELDELFYNNDLNEKIILGLGVVNPRHSRVETVEEIVARAEEALKFVPPEQVWLNPDCGFETFSHRPMNPYDIIEEKIANMVEASKILQEKYGK